MTAIKSRAVTTKIPPVWDEIEKVRQTTEAFLREQGYDDETVATLTMVSSELAENAVKYGSFHGMTSHITHRIEVSRDNIVVEVIHPTRTEDAFHLQRLDTEIQWIRGFQNPFEAYLRKMREVSAKEISDTESGFGLVRIAYEGQSVLDFFLNDGGLLAVSAVYSAQ